MRKYESSLPATGIKYTALIARYKNLLTLKDEKILMLSGKYCWNRALSLFLLIYYKVLVL